MRIVSEIKKRSEDHDNVRSCYLVGHHLVCHHEGESNGDNNCHNSGLENHYACYHDLSQYQYENVEENPENLENVEENVEKRNADHFENLESCYYVPGHVVCQFLGSAEEVEHEGHCHQISEETFACYIDLSHFEQHGDNE